MTDVEPALDSVEAESKDGTSEPETLFSIFDAGKQPAAAVAEHTPEAVQEQEADSFTQENQQPRARRAQRSKRVNLPDNTASSPTMASSTTGPKTPPSTEMNSVEKSASNKSDAGDGHKERAEQPTQDEINELEDLPQLLSAVSFLLETTVGFLRGFCNFFVDLGRIFTRRFLFYLGLVLFIVTVDLLAVYVCEPKSTEQLSGFSAKAQYVVQAHAWPLGLLALVALLYMWGHSPHHEQFISENLQEIILVFLNSLVLATYMDASVALWLWLAVNVATAFRMVDLLLPLCMHKKKVSDFWSGPMKMLGISLALYNMVNVLGSYTGYVQLGPDTHIQPEAHTDSESWGATMCDVVERVFCHPPIPY